MAKEDNLTPFTPNNASEMGAKGGAAKKGSKHLKTLIQEIGSNIDWSKTTLKDKDRMQKLYGNNAWEALVYVQLTKAMAGDPKAAEWLAKNGYGTNIDITSNGETIKGATIEFIDNPEATDTDTELS